MYFKWWKGKIHKQEYSTSKAVIQIQWKIKSFTDKQKLKEFSTTKPALGFSDSSVGKESACNAGDPSSIPWSGIYAGEWIGYPLQNSWASLWLSGKESIFSGGDLCLILRLGRFPGEGKGYPHQYSGLENSMDYIVHGITKSQTRLSDFHLFHKTLVNALQWAALALGLSNSCLSVSVDNRKQDSWQGRMRCYDNDTCLVKSEWMEAGIGNFRRLCSLHQPIHMGEKLCLGDWILLYFMWSLENMSDTGVDAKRK